MSISFEKPTALLLIDNQVAFDVPPNQPSHWGTSRSNPSYEANLSSLLTAFRSARSNPASNIQDIIHIFHSSTSPSSPLHPDALGNGTKPLPFAEPRADGSEPVMWKCVNSAFVGTNLESHLRERGIRQLVVAGITTDHCVSTSVRMAANLGVVDRYPDGPVRINQVDGRQEGEGDVRVDRGRIVLVADATATWAKAGFDAETVHQVTVASLEGEFADVLTTDEVVGALNRFTVGTE